MLLSAHVGRAQQVWDVYGEPEKSITVTGIVKGETGTGGGSIKIYRDGKFYQEIFSGPTGKYEADLPFDSQYELEFSMPACVTKRIKVETNTPADLQNQVMEPLAFNMSLPKATGGPLDDAYATPVSRLFFDRGVGDFNRDMVAEEVFRNTLRMKQGEQKRWLEEEKAKSDAEKAKQREEDLARKKAEEQARAAEARQKAEQDARVRAEADARKAADAATAQKAQEEAARKAQEDAYLNKVREEERRKQEEIRKKLRVDSLFRENEKQRLAKEAADAEKELLRKEAEDLALWQKMNDRTAELEKKRQKEIQDSLFRENDKLRLAKEAADKKEAESKKLEDDEAAHRERMAKDAREAEAERRRKEISDSLYLEQEKARESVIAEVRYGGGGKSVFYKVEEEAPPPRVKDQSAVERAKNWQRKNEERKQAYLDRIQRRKEESARLKTSDTRKERDLMERLRQIEERRKLIAERNRQREEAAEQLRKARLQESLDKKIVLLIAYSSGSSHNPNSKFYGYVNFGDGKGPLELTESEYKELAARFSGIYNKP